MDEEIEMRRDRLQRRAKEMAGAQSGEPSPASGEMPAMTSETALHAQSTSGERLSRQAKLRRALVAVGAVMLAVVVLAALLPNAGASLRAALGIPTPVPTATLPIGGGTFLIEDTVPWGTLLVDGHIPSNLELPPVPPATVGPSAPTFVLDRGRHTVEYRAAPFPTLRCVVSVPAALSDTCPLAQPSPNDPVQAFGAARVLDLQARPERLPPEQVKALEQTLVGALNADTLPAPVAVGERYLGADGAVHVATQPLVASLVYMVNQDSNQTLPGDTGPCVALCRSYAADQPPLYAEPDWWLITAHLVLTWRFRRLDGTVVATDVPAAPVARDAHELSVLSAQWNGAWEPVGFNYRIGLGMVCDVATRALGVTVGAPSGGQGLASYTWHAYLAQPASEGCLVAGAQQSVGAGYEPIGPTAFVLYRFGVLLAANDLAHQFFPTLPLADARERALARSLAPPGAEG